MQHLQNAYLFYATAAGKRRDSFPFESSTSAFATAAGKFGAFALSNPARKLFLWKQKAQKLLLLAWEARILPIDHSRIIYSPIIYSPIGWGLPNEVRLDHSRITLLSHLN
jgi:hypothetical protein